MGKKSTAQPRPKLKIPPKGIGPVEDPNENDVLCGRGGRINAHQGNVQFREIVHARKSQYLHPTTKKLEKAHIAAKLVSDIREMSPSGRFLRQERDGMWWDIGDAKAIKKVGQALREDAPGIRTEFGDEDDSSGDEGHREDEKKISPVKATSAQVVTPSQKSPGGNKKKTPPKQQPPRNVVSGRGPAHVQSQPQWVGPHADTAHLVPDYTIGENYPAHHDHGIPAGVAMPSPMAPWEQHPIAAQNVNPFVSQRFEQPLGMRTQKGQMAPSRGLDALGLDALDLNSSKSVPMEGYGYISKSKTNLTSSSDPTNGPTEQIVFGKPFNTTLVSSGSTNFSSISGLSADEAKLRLSSGSSEERKLLQYQAAMRGSSAAVRRKQARGRASAYEAARDTGDQSAGAQGTGLDAIATKTGGQAVPMHPSFKHSVSLESKEAVIRNSLRSSQIDAEMRSNNLNLSQVDEAMEFESLRSGRSKTEMERSLRLSQITGVATSANQQGSGASDLTFSLMSVDDRLLGSSGFDGLLGGAHGTAGAVSAVEKDAEPMNDSWGTNGMPTPLGEADHLMSMNSRSTGDSQREGGTPVAETSQTNLKEVVEFPPRIPLPTTIRPRNESTGNASALTQMSFGTQGSHRSSVSRFSDSSYLQHYKSDFSSGRSTMSDLSSDLTALDLAWGHPLQDDSTRRRLS